MIEFDSFLINVCLVLMMDSAENVEVSTNTSDATNHQFSCLACHDVINDDSTSSVQCVSCEQWSHLSCTMTKEIFDMLGKTSKRKSPVKVGEVAYICKLCITMIKMKKTPSLSTENSIPNSENVPSESPQTSRNNGATNSNPSDEVTVQEAINTEHNQPKPVCSYYRKGICKHGKSGKKIFNGRECLYAHPDKFLQLL